MKRIRQADGSYREIAEDGETVRVPLTLCDSAARPMAEQLNSILQDEQPPGHRPGFRLPAVNTDAARQMDVNDAMRATRRAMLGDAWRTS